MWINTLGALCVAAWLGAVPPAEARQADRQTNQVTDRDADGAAVPGSQALSAGRRAKGEGSITRAEAHFQEALAAADHDDDVYRTALDELTYYLPLMRVERYVLNGQGQRADRSLQDLLEQHQSDEERSQHLVGLIARLRDRAPAGGGVYTESGEGREAIRHIQQTLDRFLESNGRYPDGYEELNRILPAERYPLNDYDIVHYAGWGRSYGLTIRSRSNPDNLLSVQRTGLMQ